MTIDDIQSLTQATLGSIMKEWSECNNMKFPLLDKVSKTIIHLVKDKEGIHIVVVPRSHMKLGYDIKGEMDSKKLKSLIIVSEKVKDCIYVFICKGKSVK